MAKRKKIPDNFNDMTIAQLCKFAKDKNIPRRSMWKNKDELRKIIRDFAADGKSSIGVVPRVGKKAKRMPNKPKVDDFPVDEIKNDMLYFKTVLKSDIPLHNQAYLPYDIDGPYVRTGENSAVRVDTRFLGKWKFRKDDEDFPTWKDREVWEKKFEDWAKKKKWFGKVELHVSEDEKGWSSFYILKKRTSKNEPIVLED